MNDQSYKHFFEETRPHNPTSFLTLLVAVAALIVSMRSCHTASESNNIAQSAEAKWEEQRVFVRLRLMNVARGDMHFHRINVLSFNASNRAPVSVFDVSLVDTKLGKISLSPVGQDSDAPALIKPGEFLTWNIEFDQVQHVELASKFRTLMQSDEFKLTLELTFPGKPSQDITVLLTRKDVADDERRWESDLLPLHD